MSAAWAVARAVEAATVAVRVSMAVVAVAVVGMVGALVAGTYYT